jgi:hypothetical protein
MHLQNVRREDVRELTKEPERPTLKKAPIARPEAIDAKTRSRFEAALDSAIRGGASASGDEAKLAGALRAVAESSPSLRLLLAEAVASMLRKNELGRPLYGAALRSVAECGDKATTPLLRAALASDDAGGTSALTAACLSRDPALAPQLAKLAASRQSHLSFGAEIARVARGESSGAHLVGIAPMIKESHRIALCNELFLPLLRRPPLRAVVGPALTVLRGAERHLGRWLVLGEVAAKAGDETPLRDAIARTKTGPTSARAAWSLVTWALEQAMQRKPSAPETKPTTELMARLSDRPSADRDMTFLFRLADAKVPASKGMLDLLAKTPPFEDGVAVRAAFYLARDHAREDLHLALMSAAESGREEIRGIATAALFELGFRERARELADGLVLSQFIGNVAWGVLIRAAAVRRGESVGESDPLLGETQFRWIHWGWLE